MSKDSRAARREDLKRRADAHFAEVVAVREQKEAEARVRKWDTVVRRMTARGEDHVGRDVAIRNRDCAQREARDAETRALNAKFGR
ncbi:hypothetical protein ACIQNU_04200 [Streptomyces sp. NPDC091292]|uniref:hypothetical protein n=1 Tax=Streptomyces sp. NPDC091292 TaxID=3365991 RepID=UPI0037FC6ECA